jgi:polyisoprenoid-binding protein YceI
VAASETDIGGGYLQFVGGTLRPCSTGSSARDERLRSDFFDVEHHPAISLHARADAGARQLRGKGKLRRSEFGLE